MFAFIYNDIAFGTVAIIIPSTVVQFGFGPVDTALRSCGIQNEVIPKTYELSSREYHHATPFHGLVMTVVLDEY